MHAFGSPERREWLARSALLQIFFVIARRERDHRRVFISNSETVHPLTDGAQDGRMSGRKLSVVVARNTPHLKKE
jgi:hypothetical protein